MIGVGFMAKNVQFIGVNKLEAFEQQIFNSELDRFFDKIGKVHNLENAVVHLKRYSKTGKRHKNSLHCRISLSGKMFTAKAVEWNAEKALARCIKKLEKEISHKFKSKGLF